MSVDPAALRALAQRTRWASGPDRAPDADVARALGVERPRSPLDPGGSSARGWVDWVPLYTTSDRAVIRDVLPKGLGWQKPIVHGGRWHVSCGGYPAAEAATPTLALLAAALEARAALTESAP